MIVISIMCRVIFSEYYFKDHIGNKCTLVCFIVSSLVRLHACSLINKLSDHQPCFIILYITFSGCNNPKFTRKYVQLENVIDNINNDICSSELDDKIDKRLTADPNIS